MAHSRWLFIYTAGQQSRYYAALALSKQLRTTRLLLEIEARDATFRREPLREYLAKHY